MSSLMFLSKKAYSQAFKIVVNIPACPLAFIPEKYKKVIDLNFSVNHRIVEGNGRPLPQQITVDSTWVTQDDNGQKHASKSTSE